MRYRQKLLFQQILQHLVKMKFTRDGRHSLFDNKIDFVTDLLIFILATQLDCRQIRRNPSKIKFNVTVRTAGDKKFELTLSQWLLARSSVKVGQEPDERAPVIFPTFIQRVENTSYPISNRVSSGSVKDTPQFVHFILHLLSILLPYYHCVPKKLRP